MGRMQRTKGAAFERLLANLWRAVASRSRRGIGQARSAGEVCDVEGTRWWIEAKHHARPNILGAWKQATEATDGRPVLVISRANNGPILATMTLDDLLRMEAQIAAQPREEKP